MKFIVHGNPKPQGRPRFFRRGNFVGTYDPKDSKDFKQKVSECFISSGGQLINSSINMKVEFYFKRPKNKMRKNDSDFRIICDKRPDIDNLIKTIFDALNGLAFRDDGQVHHVDAWKWYHEKSGAQRTEIEIF